MTTIQQIDGVLLSVPANDAKGMFRSAFGDPKPANYDQLIEAADELGIDFKDSEARIYADCGDPAPFNGWTAEVAFYDVDDEHIELNTAGFPTREDLFAALIKAGVRTRKIEDDEI